MLLEFKKSHVPQNLHAGILFLAGLTLLITTFPAFALDREYLSKQIVVVRGYAKSEIISVRNGLVINADTYNGFVLTNADLFSEIETFTVLDANSGAELIAQLVWMDTKLDLALIKASGLKLPPVVFSKQDPGEGDQVISIRKSLQPGGRLSLARGTIRRNYPYAMPEQSINLVFHDAGLEEEAAAILLVNDCDQLVGFNLRGDSDNLKRSISARSLRSLLARQKISTSLAPERCLSPIERAQRQAELAAAQAQQARDDAALAEKKIRVVNDLLEESKKQNKSLIQKTGRAESRADKALEEVNRIQHEVNVVREEAAAQTRNILSETQQLLDNLEKERRQSNEKFQKLLMEQKNLATRRQNLMYGAILVLFFSVVTAVIIMRRRQNPNKKDVPEEAPPAPSHTVLQKNNFAEYVLDGKDDGGIRYMLRISSDQLSNPEGVVIGRNPTDSSYVINHADVSRNHACLRIMKNRLFIEDLKSTNGTIVNGQAISGSGLVAIGEGDQIIFGSIVMNLRVLQVA
jgi:hypothetical protein